MISHRKGVNAFRWRGRHGQAEACAELLRRGAAANMVPARLPMLRACCQRLRCRCGTQNARRPPCLYFRQRQWKGPAKWECVRIVICVVVAVCVLVGAGEPGRRDPATLRFVLSLSLTLSPSPSPSPSPLISHSLSLLLSPSLSLSLSLSLCIYIAYCDNNLNVQNFVHCHFCIRLVQLNTRGGGTRNRECKPITI